MNLRKRHQAMHPESSKARKDSAQPSDDTNTSKLIRIVRDGDLQLAVGMGPHGRLFSVSRACMKSVDPLYVEIVAKESTRQANSAIWFQDDDPEPFKILLDLLHLGRLDELPDTMEFERLYRVAALAYKYRISTGELLDSGFKWTRHHQPLALDSVHEGWLVIAWVLNLPEIFKSVWLQVIDNLEVKRVNDQVHSTIFGRHLDNGLPPDFLRSILWGRRRLLGYQLNICYAFLNQLERFKVPCVSENNEQICKISLLLSFRRALAMNHLPLHGIEVRIVPYSVSHMRGVMENVEQRVLDDNEHCHTLCRPEQLRSFTSELLTHKHISVELVEQYSLTRGLGKLHLNIEPNVLSTLHRQDTWILEPFRTRDGAIGTSP